MALSLRLPAVAIALWLAPLAIAQRSAISPEPPALSVVELGKAAVSLDGLWQFRLGDDPKWASPALDDSTWQPIEVGDHGKNRAIATTRDSHGNGAHRAREPPSR